MVGYAAGDYYGQLSSIMDQEGIKDLCKYTGYTSLEDFENSLAYYRNVSAVKRER